MKDTALRASAIIFLLVSIMHLLRFILKVKVTFGSLSVPVWFSIPGFLATFLLSLWLFSLAKKSE